jgi:pantothenate kinase
VENIDNGIVLFDTDLKETFEQRFEGRSVGGGLLYGYSWMIRKGRSFETVYVLYDSAGTKANTYVVTVKKNSILIGLTIVCEPTKIALNILYWF